ncbi:MAG: hypothetical protein HY549_10465 [Elusimicrobia bacterium]|nr:hypothetical protein [Elusimicrobiota bacterium]
MIDKYGQPNEFTNSLLVWHNNGPWERTIVHRDGVAHNFPRKHSDVLQQFIKYRVPVDKFDDLAAFDGSLYPDRTRGELSAKSDREEMNVLALNLADDIIRGKKTVEQARQYYDRAATLSLTGKSDPYISRMNFRSGTLPTADEDKQLKHKEIGNGGASEMEKEPGSENQ